jgi:hypothetical protein
MRSGAPAAHDVSSGMIYLACYNDAFTGNSDKKIGQKHRVYTLVTNDHRDHCGVH